MLVSRWLTNGADEALSGKLINVLPVSLPPNQVQQDLRQTLMHRIQHFKLPFSQMKLENSVDILFSLIYLSLHPMALMIPPQVMVEFATGDETIPLLIVVIQ